MVLAASGYFRIIRPRLGGTARATSTAPADASVPIGAQAGAPIRIPHVPVELKTLETKAEPEKRSLFIEPISSIRDIFSEPPAPVDGEKEEKKEEKPKPPPTQLKGTIVGGEHPIAIISGRFLRVGEWIDDYQVLQIEKDQVRLSSGKHDIVLEVFKNAHP